VEGFQSDEQQVEELKKWWAENGKSIITGVVLGLGLILGWQGWNGYVTGRGEAASAQYEQMLMRLDSEQPAQAVPLAEGLVQEYADTPYAALAALAVARVKLEADEPVAARGHLQWVVEHATMDELKWVARQRLAEVWLQEGNVDAAAETLVVEPPAAFEAGFQALRGDIALARGDVAAARAAYQVALAGAPDGPARGLLQLKLGDLGGPASEE